MNMTDPYSYIPLVEARWQAFRDNVTKRSGNLSEPSSQMVLSSPTKSLHTSVKQSPRCQRRYGASGDGGSKLGEDLRYTCPAKSHRVKAISNLLSEKHCSAESVPLRRAARLPSYEWQLAVTRANIVIHLSEQMSMGKIETLDDAKRIDDLLSEAKQIEETIDQLDSDRCSVSDSLEMLDLDK